MLAIFKKALLVASIFLSTISFAQDIKVVQWEELESSLKTDKVLVMNFWATWCRPCLEELPAFEAVNKTQKKDAKVILVSLDQASLLESKVKPMVQRLKLESEVVLLDMVDFNAWIPKINKDWLRFASTAQQFVKIDPE